MIPCLRVILPSASLTETAIEGSITKGLNIDYIANDPTGAKSLPVGALYAARMDSNGKIIEILPSVGLGATHTHTFAGWPIPG